MGHVGHAGHNTPLAQTFVGEVREAVASYLSGTWLRDIRKRNSLPRCTLPITSFNSITSFARTTLGRFRS